MVLIYQPPNAHVQISWILLRNAMGVHILLHIYPLMSLISSGLELDTVVPYQVPWVELWENKEPAPGVEPGTSCEVGNVLTTKSWRHLITMYILQFWPSSYYLSHKKAIASIDLSNPMSWLSIKIFWSRQTIGIISQLKSQLTRFWVMAKVTWP
jgi:hypothetical protein